METDSVEESDNDYPYPYEDFTKADYYQVDRLLSAELEKPRDLYFTEKHPPGVDLISNPRLILFGDPQKG